MKALKILLGITGGIAAYKSAELCRMFVKAQADVRVVMSEAACKFITPLTMETLSGKPVPVEMFGRTEGPLEHINVPDAADVMVIAPATADYLARCATGRASDLISAVTLAFTGPVVVAPAMNTNMWNNPATQRNLATLADSHSWQMVEPGSGMLACGWTGKGRMASVEEIFAAVETAMKRDMEGRRILVTAGPTVEDLDPVRFLSNRSTGTMGYAIAEAAARRGASVTLVSGPVSLRPPTGVETIEVRCALEMNDAVNDMASTMDAVVMCAAVADYRPDSMSGQKIKKGDEDSTLSLNLVRNPDILAGLGKRFESKDRPLLVGFALETEKLLESARTKLHKKKVDLIVANLAADSLGTETTRATLVSKQGSEEETGSTSKKMLAATILDNIADMLSQQRDTDAN